MSAELVLPAFCADDGDIAQMPTLTLVSTNSVEPVGFWYHSCRALVNDDGTAAYATETGGGSNDPAAKRFTGGGSKKFVKLSDEDLETDWYEVMAINADDNLSENDIRAAYKQRCLETHPDKQPNHSDVMFKKVQRAFEILGTTEGRRAFDSSRPFDNAIPLETFTLKGDDAKFYTTFAHIFERNKKWSQDANIMGLGDETTDVKDVRKFYDQWLCFRTWRDFSHAPEIEKVEENMPREEKRYYMKENIRIMERCKRDEQKRVRNLVDRALKLDPRLRKVREVEQEAKDKEKADKLAEKEKVRMEEALKKAAIANLEKEAADAVLAEKDAEKRRMKEAFEELMAFLQTEHLLDPVNTNMILPNLIRKPNVTWLFKKITCADEAAEFVAGIKSQSPHPEHEDAVPAVLAFNEILTVKEQAIGVNRYGEPCKRHTPEEVLAKRKELEAARAEAAKRSASGVEWTEEDLATLHKAIAKYPGGTLDRWAKMAQLLNEKFTEDEVLVKTKALEAQAKKGMGAISKEAQAAAATSSVTPSASAPDAAGGANQGAMDWTPEQQKALEKGLREMKNYKQKDKYKKISQKVDGKNAKECHDRFKYLCALNKE